MFDMGKDTLQITLRIMILEGVRIYLVEYVTNQLAGVLSTQIEIMDR
jgi:hypothetical protein